MHDRVDLVTVERDANGRIAWAHIDPRWRTRFASSPALLRMRLQVAIMSRTPKGRVLPSGSDIYGRLGNLASARLVHRVRAQADIALNESSPIENRVSSLRGEVVVTVAGDRIVGVALSEDWLRHKAVDGIAQLITQTLQDAESHLHATTNRRRAELDDMVAEVTELLDMGIIT